MEEMSLKIRNEELCKAYASGERLSSISKRTGISYTQLNRIFTKNGVSRKKHELDLAYFESNKDRTKRQISNITGISLKKVGYLYKVAYGKKLTKGKIDFTGNKPEVDPGLINDREWLKLKYEDEKLGMPSIARLLATKTSIIYRKLHEYNIQVRTLKNATILKRKRPTKEWLMEYYINDKWSIQRFAAEFGTGFEAILSALQEYDIPTRSASTQHMGQLNEFYGKTHPEEIREYCVAVGTRCGSEYWLTGDIESKREFTRKVAKEIWADPEIRRKHSEKIAELCRLGKCNPKSRLFYCQDGQIMLLRSSWEETVAGILDANEEVLDWQYEGLVIPYMDKENNFRHFVVDFWVKWRDNLKTLIECKNEYLLGQESEQIKVDAMREFCKKNNLGCIIISDKDDIHELMLGYKSKVEWIGTLYYAPVSLSKDPQLFQELAVHEIMNKIIPWPGITYSEAILQEDLMRLHSEKLESYMQKDGWHSTAPNSGGMPGRKIMTHFNPHFWQVSAKGRRPLPEAFKDKNIIYDCLRISLSEGESLNFERLLREINFHYTNYARASHFAPGFARTVIRHFGASGKIIFDPCCGWGGRLIGAWLEHCVYKGCDLSKETYDSLQEIRKFLNYPTEIVCSSCLALEWPKSDLIFTSPPYFDEEEYIGDDQPWKKYKSREEWISGFVISFIKKINGLCALYVDNLIKADFESVRKFDEIIVIKNRRHARKKAGEEYLGIYNGS